MKCESCNKEIKGRLYYKNQCQACYNYFRGGGIIHPLPNYGEVCQDDTGKYICHICGRSFESLGHHIYNFHNLTRKEYSEIYGLNSTGSLCSEVIKNNHRKHITSNFEIVVSKNLIEKGAKTRYRLGSSGRVKEQVREQTRKYLSTRRVEGFNIFNNKRD